MNDKIKAQEAMQKEYSEQLRIVEQDIAVRQKYQNQDDLGQLEAEEAKLDAELAALDQEENEAKAEIVKMGEYHKEIEAEQNQYWNDFNKYERQVNQQQDTHHQMRQSLDQLKKKLQRLQETTFINEIFRISAVDEIGTIGGLRLGRTQKNTDVTWDEINAAMGQVVYLMVVLAHRLGY